MKKKLTLEEREAVIAEILRQRQLEPLSERSDEELMEIIQRSQKLTGEDEDFRKESSKGRKRKKESPAAGKPPDLSGSDMGEQY